VAVLLFPAHGFRAERDLYRALRANGGIHHPAAEQVRARIAALSGGPLFRVAPVTTALMVVLLLVHLFVEARGDTTSVLTLLEYGANQGTLVKGGEPWRLLSAIFLHSGWLHLLLNVGGLWIVGKLLEPEIGWARTIVIFYVSGIVGNLASLVVYQSDPLVGVGASGGLMGMLGCLLLLMIQRKDHPQRARLLRPLLILTAASLALGLIVPGIDNGAHVGGLVAGLLLGLVFSRVSRLPENAVRLAAAVFLMLTVMAVVQVLKHQPGWRRLALLTRPAYELLHPAGAEAGMHERCNEINWRPCLATLTIEVIGRPADPAETLAAAFVAKAGDRSPDAVNETSVIVEDGAARVEVHLLDDLLGERSALLCFILPGGDPILRDRWVAPVLNSFRFR
jgi:membrane associated rhomboid family serine protease